MDRPSVDKAAQTLAVLARCGLHSTGMPKIFEGSKEETLLVQEPVFEQKQLELYSRDAGVDYSGPQRGVITTYSYDLRERSLPDRGKMHAEFYFVGNRLAIAYSILEDYAPGPASLTVRWLRAPPGYTRGRIPYRSITRIDIFSRQIGELSWEHGKFYRHVAVRDPANLRRLAVALKRAPKARGFLPLYTGSERYQIEISYSNGAVLRGEMYPRRDGKTVLRYPLDFEEYYLPDSTFYELVRDIVNAGA